MEGRASANIAIAGPVCRRSDILVMVTAVLFAERWPCLPKFSGSLLGMEKNIADLGLLVRARREELGLSQEDVAKLWGPSTTTLSKIELGEAKAIRRRTSEDIEKSLGWKAGSIEAYLYGGHHPVVVQPAPPARDAGDRPREDEPTEGPWLTVRAERDEREQRTIVGVSVSTDPDGVRTRVEVRYWPSDDNRSVSMSMFPTAVGEAHRLALEATNVFRAPQTEQKESDDHGTTPSTQKTELERLREERDAAAQEVSDRDASLDPAADRFDPESDKEPGGSD